MKSDLNQKTMDSDILISQEDHHDLQKLEKIYLGKVSTKGYFFKTNINLYNLLDLTKYKIYNYQFFELFPKSFQKKFKSLLATKESKAFTDEFLIDGKQLIVRWSMYKDFFPDYYWLVGNGSTTSSKQISDLVESEIEIKSNILQNTMPYLKVSMDGKIIEYNEQLAKIFKFNPDKNYKGYKLLNHYKNPEDRDKYFASLSEKGSVKNYRISVLDINNEPFEAIINSRYLYGNNGDKIGTEITFSYHPNQADFIGKIFDNEQILQHKINTRTKKLIELNQLLDSKNIELEKKNIALNELIDLLQYSEDNLNNTIQNNITNVILPLVHKLKVHENNNNTIKVFDILEENLKSITSNYGNGINKELSALSKRELEIANFIRSGLSSKEISKILSISETTIVSHRNHIRKKLKLNNSKTNLATYLDSL